MLLAGSIAGCASTEDIGLTELDLGAADVPAPLMAGALVGEARLANERLSDAVRGLGERARTEAAPDALIGAYPVPFDQFSESQLADWFEDIRVLSARTPDDDFAASLAAAARTRGAQPTGAQASGLARLHASALGPIEVSWNGIRGTPGSIEGPLFARRNLSGEALADAFLAEHASTLGSLFPLHPDDRLVHAGSSLNWDETLEEHAYVRTRGGVSFELDQIAVFVTTDQHRFGAGIVWRVYATWERAASDMTWGASMPEAEARARAAAELGAELDDEHTWVEQRIVCRAVGGTSERACRPAWAVHATDPTIIAGEGPDTMVIDAETGSVIARDVSAVDYDGTVRVTSNFPYETSDSFRGFSSSRLISGSYTTALSSTGSYTGFSPTSSTAWVGLENSGTPGPLLFNSPIYDCASPVDGRHTSFTLGGTDNITAAPNNSTLNRHRFLFWNWFQWGFRSLNSWNNFVQLDDELYYSVTDGTSGANGQYAPCGTHVRLFAAAGTDDSTLSVAVARYFAFHEFGHAIANCTRGWAPGCPGTLGDPRTPILDMFSEGIADSFSMWANAYETNYVGNAFWHVRTYDGPGISGDLLLDDDEIDGTPISGVDQYCRIGGVYQCTSIEACWSIASDHPRCMFRASNIAQCQSFFPGETLIDWQPKGTDDVTFEPSIGICVSNGYNNGRAAMVLATNLITTRGFFGFPDLLATVRNYTHQTEVAVNPSAPSDTLHDIIALRSPRYTTTRALHRFSTESFAWLDDVGDYAAVSEVSRIARNTQIVQTNGGATGIPLRFNTTTDVDVFLVAVAPGESFQVQATTASTSVDLCLVVYRVTDGIQVATAGCSDGSSTAALRNATATFSTGTTARYLVTVSNVLGIANVTYDFRTVTLTDDFPDVISRAVAARALRPGVAESGTMNGTGDADLFRYDRPTSAGSASLSFTLSTAMSPVPQLEVFFSADETVPTTPIVTSTTGTATVTTPSVGHYYVRVINPGTTTATYTVTANAGATCGTTCSGSGTLAAPMSLPTSEGGELVERLTGFGAAWESASCSDGTNCDWFRVTLAENERFSVTSYGITPGASCNLELAVFMPSDVVHFYGGANERYPALMDRGGSPDVGNGGQLTYIARHAGVHTIGVRSRSGAACSTYYLGVTRMRADTGSQIPPSINF